MQRLGMLAPNVGREGKMYLSNLYGKALFWSDAVKRAPTDAHSGEGRAGCRIRAEKR